MFNLEQAILEWRRQMLAAEIKAPVPLDELESHLRDEIEHQTKSGLSEMEAFKTAVTNIGQATALQMEFRKVQRTKGERTDSVDQIMLVVLPYAISLISLYEGFTFTRSGALGRLTVGQQVSCYFAIATMLLLVWGGRLSYRIFPVIRAKRIRNAINYVGGGLLGLWWITFFYVVMPWYQEHGSVFVVLYLWGFQTPTGALIGWLLGSETAARKNAAAAIS